MIAPYGSWASPITADLIASAGTSLGSVLTDGDDCYWTEMRPTEGGRVVLVRQAGDGAPEDLTPAPFSARTTVHEYGGGAVAIALGAILFSNFSDQRLFRAEPGTPPRPITPEGPWRYADGVIDLPRQSLICVREDHTNATQSAVNTIVGVSLDDSEQKVLVAGNDFYSTPRLSANGEYLAWLTWNQPNMPWDGTELWVGDLSANGESDHMQLVAGGPGESVFQPEWSPGGTLTFVSDRTGWWNLYQWRDGQVQALCPMEAEFGAPQWVFGMSTYGFASDHEIICSYSQDGTSYLARLDARTGRLVPIALPYTSISSVRVNHDRAYFLGSAAAERAAVVQLDLGTGVASVVHQPGPIGFETSYISQPRAIQFPTGVHTPPTPADSQGRSLELAGVSGVPLQSSGTLAHAFFYAPANPHYSGPADERPPLLVMSHGGPTSATTSAFRRSVQYWTTRGFAVLDVNYGGSSGYGRAYRERLNGNWGVVDVDDCVNGARYLVGQDLVDGDRLAITGGSAGGYTTLCALTFRDVFRAGASHYGVSDCEALARDTHKFEARYLDRLIGPYPERRDLYYARSPINFADRLSSPVIFLQGLEDRIVPPNQAETMVAALRAKGVPVAYLTFEGEQHGFRRAESIRSALEAELYFYSRVFGFDLADPIPPIQIDNL